MRTKSLFSLSLPAKSSQTFKTAVLAQLRPEQLDIRAKQVQFSAEISRHQAKVGELALPAGFCNDLAIDGGANNLFVTNNRLGAGTEAIYKLTAVQAHNYNGLRSKIILWRPKSCSTEAPYAQKL